MNTATRLWLLQLALLCDETEAALESGGVPALILKTFLDAATPIWTAIQQDAAIANTPEAPAGTAAPAAPDTSSAPQTPPESASAGTPGAKVTAENAPLLQIEPLPAFGPQKHLGL